MRTKEHVIPQEGLLVRDPERGCHLPAEGATVPLTPYWRRRLRDGDVVLAAKQPKPRATRKPVPVDQDSSPKGEG
jgi:hypothetical protein